MNEVVSKSTQKFQLFIDEQQDILLKKKKARMMSIYEEISPKKKDDPVLARFYELIHTDIGSIEIMSLVYKLLHCPS